MPKRGGSYTSAVVAALGRKLHGWDISPALGSGAILSGPGLLVWEHDEELDDLYNSAFRQLLTYMMENPRNISQCAHLLFAAKNVERIGDHVTNVAENIHYVVEGRPPVGSRPKKETTLN